MDRVIEKYEIRRTVACMAISLLTIIVSGILVGVVKNNVLAIVVASTVCMIGCLLISFCFRDCEKRIKKYKKDNAEQLSLDSSQL